jgi:O-antigen/teichoic acid export membrane protein
MNPIMVASVFLFAVSLTLAVSLYLLWIVFSYSIHLKHKRVDLIEKKIIIKFEDYERRHV